MNPAPDTRLVDERPLAPAAPGPALPAVPGGPMRERDLSFLVAATRLLSESLDVEKTLSSVARLSLPHFGSWCVVDLMDGDEMRRLAIIHPDPAQQALADQLLAGWPPARDDPLGVPSVVRTGRSEIVFPVTDEMLVAAARSPDNLAILRALEIGSFMSVPLVARGRVFGAITYVSPNHGDSFSERDLKLAEDLAARCAIAIDNSRLLQAAHRAEAAAAAAQAEAQEANLTKMRFLSTMSHELRTPLNAIAGYAELLETGLRGPMSEAQLTDVRRIRANQRHLLSLVESVLDYAKIEAGRAEFDLEDVPIAEVLKGVDEVVIPLAGARGVSYRTRALHGGEGLTVYADREKLQQVLINLLANAIKFSGDAGEVELTYRGVGENVEIRVSDNGIGIAPEYLDRIFEPFVQVNAGYTQEQGGTGLGLAISRELAVGMGGELGVRSEMGEGSTFTLTLSRGRS